MAVARAASTARRLPLSEPGPPRPGGDRAVAPATRCCRPEHRRASRAVHRQANLLRFLGVMLVVGALAVTAAAHTFVASDQQRIDALQAQLSQNLAQEQNLQIARAELESPQRVLAIAEHQLGMVAPSSVTYLAPVNPGPSVAQVESGALARVTTTHENASARSRTASHRTSTGDGSSRAASGASAVNGNG